jgi:hypothetical protein
VRHHQRRPVDLGDCLGHRERLARASNAEQHLMCIPAVQPIDELWHRAHLIAR